MSKTVKITLGILLVISVVSAVLMLASREYLATGRLSQKVAFEIHGFVAKHGGINRSVDQIELIIRKLAHFVEYLIMGSVVYVVISHWSKNRFLTFLLVLMICVPIPFVDEYVVQAGTMGRSSQILDVMIDLLGIGVAVILGLIYEFIFMRQKSY